MSAAVRTGREATLADVRKARMLRQGGWSYPQIVHIFAEDGLQVSVTALRRWVDPAEADRHREYMRGYMRDYRRRPPDPRRDPAELARRLRAEGQPVEGIVRVCRVVFGGRWTRGMVLRLLERES